MKTCLGRRFTPPGTPVYVPTPTWGNHVSIIKVTSPSIFSYYESDSCSCIPCPLSRTLASKRSDTGDNMNDVRQFTALVCNRYVFLLGTCALTRWRWISLASCRTFGVRRGAPSSCCTPARTTPPVNPISCSLVLACLCCCQVDACAVGSPVIFVMLVIVAAGVDPTNEQWCELSDVLKSAGHIVFFDSAYQVHCACLFIWLLL